MKKKITFNKSIYLFVISFYIIYNLNAQNISVKSSITTTEEYYLRLQNKLAKGWNTWDYGSLLSYVLLPEGLKLQINFRRADISFPRDPKFFLSEFNINKDGFVKPVAHTFDGSYTELTIGNWCGNTIRVQSAAKDKDVVILINQVNVETKTPYRIELETGVMWNRKGNIERKGDVIAADFGENEYNIRSTASPVHVYHSYGTPYIAVDGGQAIGFYTGEKKSLAQLTAIVEMAKNDYENNAKKYGELAEGFKVIQSVLGWNTLYDAGKNRVITPVTRGWSKSWQGYVLFTWDTYLTAYLFSLENKDLAYSNAIAISKTNRLGFFGQWQMPENRFQDDLSNPPVGSMLCWKIYDKYKEKWFLEAVYNELFIWNRWWLENRMNKGLLTWGGEKHQFAAWESGLDNSPMWEGVKMIQVGKNKLFNIADVGLNSLYIADCYFLAKIAEELGKKDDEKALLESHKFFSKKINELWNEEKGIYLNKYTDSTAFSSRLSPTLFYPMYAGVSSPEQAKRMLDEHIYNPKEFYGEYMLPSCPYNDISYDNNYWRGSVWAPMNLLVYFGLQNYNKAAAFEISQKSYQYFMSAWKANNYVLENTNSRTGPLKKEDQVDCDPYYTWGALNGIMEFIEKGYHK
jgi:putative isomerase